MATRIHLRTSRNNSIYPRSRRCVLPWNRTSSRLVYFFFPFLFRAHTHIIYSPLIYYLSSFIFPFLPPVCSAPSPLFSHDWRWPIDRKSTRDLWIVRVRHPSLSDLRAISNFYAEQSALAGRMNSPRRYIYFFIYRTHSRRVLVFLVDDEWRW